MNRLKLVSSTPNEQITVLRQANGIKRRGRPLNAEGVPKRRGRPPSQTWKDSKSPDNTHLSQRRPLDVVLVRFQRPKDSPLFGVLVFRTGFRCYNVRLVSIQLLCLVQRLRYTFHKHIVKLYNTIVSIELQLSWKRWPWWVLMNQLLCLPTPNPRLNEAKFGGFDLSEISTSHRF